MFMKTGYLKDNTGFGNNAEELRTASVLMDNIVIRPFQTLLINSFNELLAFNGIGLNLYFVTLQPIEFTELDNIETKIKREEETGEKLSSEEKNDFDDKQGDDLLSQLESLGEKVDENDWELVHTEKVVDTEAEFDFTKLADVSKDDAKPNKSSSQDNSTYKVRYSYAPVRNSANSRRFCMRMESLTGQNLVFRKEDINIIAEDIRFIKTNKIKLFLHTNQSGVERKFYKLEDVHNCNARMIELLESWFGLIPRREFNFKGMT